MVQMVHTLLTFNLSCFFPVSLICHDLWTAFRFFPAMVSSFIDCHGDRLYRSIVLDLLTTTLFDTLVLLCSLDGLCYGTNMHLPIDHKSSKFRLQTSGLWWWHLPAVDFPLIYHSDGISSRDWPTILVVHNFFHLFLCVFLVNSLLSKSYRWLFLSYLNIK